MGGRKEGERQRERERERERLRNGRIAIAIAIAPPNMNAPSPPTHSTAPLPSSHAPSSLSSRIFSLINSRRSVFTCVILGGLLIGAVSAAPSLSKSQPPATTPLQPGAVPADLQFTSTEHEQWNKEILDRLKKAEEKKKQNKEKGKQRSNAASE